MVPNSSVNCIRVVSYMLRKTLGWVNEDGDPIQEKHEFSHRELEDAAGVSHSRLPEAIDDALKGNFVRRVQKARVQSQGIRAQSAAFELRWDEHRYTDDPGVFTGFYLQPSYVDSSGQNRIGRKNIPNIFFDYLIREENRALIRVVGTLLWYSIDWGKGGERRTTVRKSLRDLVELTQLAKGSVVRALDEAIEKGYIERVEPGVFDLAGNQHGSVTVYGIKWTSDYTYTLEGLPVSFATQSERSQNETRVISWNAPKMRHGERTQNETRNAPKMRHGERSQNETIRILKTDIPNTSIPNNSSSPSLPPAVVAAQDALVNVGFSKAIAEEISLKALPEVICRQIELLPKRSAKKNPLGLLRRAIEENWPDPEAGKTTDVGSSSSPGILFASNFYAGYHGNPEAPVAEPGSADVELAERFVNRLMGVFPSPPSEASVWGRSFGELVAARHGRKRESLPVFRIALQQYGDDFFARFRESVKAQRERSLRKAREEHYETFQTAYRAYISSLLRSEQEKRSSLFVQFEAEEEDNLKVLRENRFGLNVAKLVQDFQSEAARLERFEQFVMLSEQHEVLDFWTWDAKVNRESFQEARA